MIIDTPPGILSNMDDEQPRTRRESDAAASEPECEVHSSNDQRELQERLDNISSLQELFVKQSQTLALIEPDSVGRLEQANESMADSSSFSFQHHDESVGRFSSFLSGCKSFEETFDDGVSETLRGESGREISPTSVATMEFFDRSYFQDIEKHLDFDEADDIDSSTQLSMEGSDSDIQAAINEIRKEASQIDIVMALDQLKTVETELEVATRALRERSLEAEDLRLQLREREERISCLELERDLHEADASKLRVDLKTCVDRMFDISAVAGTSMLVESSEHDMIGVERIRDQAILRPSVSPTDSVIPAIPSSTPFDDPSDSDLKDPGRPVRQRHHQVPVNACLSSPSEPRESVVAKAFPLLGASHSSSVFREHAKTSSPTRSLSMFSESTTGRSPILESPRRHRSFSEVIRSSTKPICEGNEDTTKENRMCGLFRRRQPKRSNAKAKDVAAMRSKIDELHLMMKASLETSEKLRKRLAMISRYYEGIITKLQEQVVEIKTEKAKVKADCNSKISAMDYEKRLAILRLENKLHERVREIKGLRKNMGDQPFEI